MKRWGYFFGKNTPGQWLRQMRKGNVGWRTNSYCSPSATTSIRHTHTHTYMTFIDTQGRYYVKKGASPVSHCLASPRDSNCSDPPGRKEALRASGAHLCSFWVFAPFSSADWPLLTPYSLHPMISAIHLFTNLFNTNSTYQHIRQCFKGAI